ncbi:unnamed protein product [Schistosoma intercalatum]|nr:unnamed protein product [Schistosoma intercalatum]
MTVLQLLHHRLATSIKDFQIIVVCILSSYVNIYLIGSPEVNLFSPKFVNRKEMMNDLMMYLMSNTSLSIRDADRVLYGLRVFIPDIPKSIRGVLKTCPSVQPKFIGSGVYYHLGLKTNLLRYVELWLLWMDFLCLEAPINSYGLY